MFVIQADKQQDIFGVSDIIFSFCLYPNFLACFEHSNGLPLCIIEANAARSIRVSDGIFNNSFIAVRISGLDFNFI
ncbi:hypothetical protein D3C80_1901180 [compost metagenome]